MRNFKIKVPWGRIHAKNWSQHYQESGAKRVLLLHGNSDHVHCWDWTADLLPKNWSIVGYDFPGHGDSNFPDNYYAPTHDLFGYSIRYVADALGWDSFHCVAHSMGTFIASPFACLFPERVDSLTLIDFKGVQTIKPIVTPMYSLMSWENRADRWKADSSNPGRTPSGKTWDEYKHAIMNTPSGWFKDPRIAEKWMQGQMTELEDGNFKSKVHPFMRQWGTSSWGLTFDQSYNLARDFQAPLQYLEASEEIFDPKSNQRKYFNHEKQQLYFDRLVKYSARYEHHIIEGNHLSHMVNPSETSKRIRDFINQDPTRLDLHEKSLDFFGDIEDIARI